MQHLEWYASGPEAVARALDTTEHGLSNTEAKARFDTEGANALPIKAPDSILIIFLRQFASPLIYLLLGAAAIIYVTEGPVDAYIILAILIFNAVVGTIQEGRARNTLAALRIFAETSATVLRDGVEIRIPDREVVPGDVLILTEGEKVAADARIISVRALTINESALTGESEPVRKSVEVLPSGDRATLDQTNMVFKGTNIVAGSGTAIVVATGMRTLIGLIAHDLVEQATEIPLQATLRRLSRAIIFIVFGVSIFLFTLGLFLGHSTNEMFATVVTLAVSIIPEGLPIAMTLVLASGVWRMSKRNALVKNLQAVEALGQASIIAVDKTGTITKNEMIVERVYAEGTLFTVSGSGYSPEGDVSLEGATISPAHHPELLRAGQIAAYTAHARAVFDESAHTWRVLGDPTEAALIVLARKVGFDKEDLERESPVLHELPFTSERRFHAVAHEGTRAGSVSVTGAPEILLERSTHIRIHETTHALTLERRKEIESVILLMSNDGLRVIACAERGPTVGPLSEENVTDLTFIGFFGMKDGLKKEVPLALSRAHDAGIKVVMITGDHVATARAVALEAGIYRAGDRVMTGEEINMLTDKALADELSAISVFARVTPEHKLRIIKSYQAAGHTIAMTGDGINDAPSLVAADLGVAMGKIGTEVAKEAADIVLLDDDFGSIVSAVEEGRGIYVSIKRVALYLFATSAGVTLAITGALIVNYPIPVLPAQIIWLNFVTGGFLDIALALESKEKNLLARKFKKPGRYLFDSTMLVRMLLMGITMAVATLWLFGTYLPAGLPKALTISLTLLAVLQWFNAWSCRSEDRSLFTMNPFGNLYLIGATAIVILLQLFAVYHPLGQSVLHTVPLSFFEWQLILLTALPIIIIEEIRKAFVRLNA